MSELTHNYQDWNDIDGELLPALPGDVAPARAPIRIHLPEACDGSALIEHEVQRPLRGQTFEADVAVPILQAIATTVAAVICAGVLAWVFKWDVRVVIVTFGLVLGAAWLWRIRFAASLLWEVERLIGHDLNRDHQVGRPGTSPTIVNAWQARQEAARFVAEDETLSERQALTMYLNRCFVAGCSERDHGISRGSGAERVNYLRRRDLLLSLGIAQWRHEGKPSAGWKIAVSHQKALEILAKHVL